MYALKWSAVRFYEDICNHKPTFMQYLPYYLHLPCWATTEHGGGNALWNCCV